MILASWSSQAAIEEQTTVIHVIPTKARKIVSAQLDCAAKSVANGHGEYGRAPNVNPEGLLNFAGILLLAGMTTFPDGQLAYVAIERLSTGAFLPE
ncbi:hypothetical protein Tco_1462101, partial [Tanacetum coccineum]